MLKSVHVLALVFCSSLAVLSNPSTTNTYLAKSDVGGGRSVRSQKLRVVWAGRATVGLLVGAGAVVAQCTVGIVGNGRAVLRHGKRAALSCSFDK